MPVDSLQDALLFVLCAFFCHSIFSALSLDLLPASPNLVFWKIIPRYYLNLPVLLSVLK